MGLIPCRSAAEIPDDWRGVIPARLKPSPFDVVAYEHGMFKKWGGGFLAAVYSKKLNTPIHSIQEIKILHNKIETDDPRETYNGAFTSAVIINRKTKY